MYDKAENSIGLYPVTQHNYDLCKKAIKKAGMTPTNANILSLCLREFLKMDMGMKDEDLITLESLIVKVWHASIQGDPTPGKEDTIFVEFTQYAGRRLVYKYATPMNALTRRQNAARAEGEPKIHRNIYLHIIPQLDPRFRKLKWLEKNWRTEQERSGLHPETRVAMRGRLENTERTLYLQYRKPGAGKKFFTFKDEDFPGEVIPGPDIYKTEAPILVRHEVTYVPNKDMTPPGRRSYRRIHSDNVNSASGPIPKRLGYKDQDGNLQTYPNSVDVQSSTAGASAAAPEQSTSKERSVSVAALGSALGAIPRSTSRDNLQISIRRDTRGTVRRRSKSESSSDDPENRSHMEMLENMAVAREKLRRALKRRKKGREYVTEEELDRRKDAFIKARDEFQRSLSKESPDDDSISSESSDSDDEVDTDFDEVFTDNNRSKKTSTPNNTPKKISPGKAKTIKDNLRNSLNKSFEKEKQRKEEKRLKEVEKAKAKANRKLSKSNSSKKEDEKAGDAANNNSALEPNEDLNGTKPMET